MTLYEKLGAMVTDLRSIAKMSINDGNDDCCAIGLLAAAEAVIRARDKLALYGIDEVEWIERMGTR